MVMTKIRADNCTALIEYGRRFGAATKSSPVGKTVKLNGDSPEKADGVVVNNNSGRCVFPYQHQKGAGGYRYCSMFGDPHLRTFEGQYETCRTLGAWPLIDNSYFGVQVTNDPVSDGVDASGISKVRFNACLPVSPFLVLRYSIRHSFWRGADFSLARLTRLIFLSPFRLTEQKQHCKFFCAALRQVPTRELLSWKETF